MGPKELLMVGVAIVALVLGGAVTAWVRSRGGNNQTKS